MIIYIGMIFWILFVSGVCRKKRVQNKITGEKEYRATFLCAMLSMGIIVFFIGLRSAGADTHAYIKMFNDLPVGIENIKNVIRSDVGEKGFEIFGIFIKTFISQDYHVYLFIIAAISGFCIASVLRRYSAYFTTSMILFMLAGTFTWMINGIRQFLVASIAFFSVDLILKKRPILYILLILLLSTIHTSAIILLPVYFIVRGEAWNKRTMIVLGVSVLIIFFATRFTSFLDSALVGTQYEGAVEQFATDNGSNPIRVLINMVPIILAFINRKIVKEKGSVFINVCINMSIMGVALSLISMVTSGVLMGRLPIYFNIYNLILLPWLVKKTCGKYRKLVYTAMIMCYTFLFLYENFYVLNFYYVSDILHMSFY